MKKLKTKLITAIGLVLLIFAMLVSCANEGERTINQTGTGNLGKTRMIVDGGGRNVEIPEDVASIVCINVGALRYTTYMQSQDLVVGVEDYEKERSETRPYNYIYYDTYKDLPIIGGNGDPYLEEIIAINPNVIVLSSRDIADAESMQATTGIPVILVPGSDKMMDEDAYETIRIMGEVYRKEERAKELTDYLDGIKRDLKTRTADILEKDKPSVYVGGVSFRGGHGIEGTEAFYGPLKLIGAKNLADETDQKGPFNVELEKILSWNPDIIFIDYNGLPLINEHYGTNPDFYTQLKAVKDRKVYSQISFRSYASNLDMALINTYYNASILYPDEFKDIDPIEKADEIFEKLLGHKFYEKLEEKGYGFGPIKIGER